MRIVIENADFSSVSIGKRVKDLSFSYANGTAMLGILVNPPTGVSAVTSSISAGSGTNPTASYYTGSSSSETLTAASNANRFVSDFIEVTEGMGISSTKLGNTYTVPSIVAFDSGKNVLTPNKCAWSSGGALSYTVPSGVKYIKIQTSVLAVDTNITGTMPT